MISYRQIVQRLTLLSAVLRIGFLWVAVPAQAQTFKVGSFTKRTSAAAGSWVEVRE